MPLMRGHNGHNPKRHQKQRNQHKRPRHHGTAMLLRFPPLAPLHLPITYVAVGMWLAGRETL